MRRRTLLAAAAAALGGTGVMAGTGSFSSVETERDINVDTVDDEDAFLRLVYPMQSFECDGDIQLVEIGNHTATELTSLIVTVEHIPDAINLYRSDNAIEAGDDIVVVDEDAGESFGPGDEPTSVEAFATAEDGFTGTGDVEFQVSASGPGVSIDTDASRAVTINADCSDDDDDEMDVQYLFQQEENVVKFGTYIETSVDVWYVNGGEIEFEELWVSDDRVDRGDLENTGQVDAIIAVNLEDSDTLYVSPFWPDEDAGEGFEPACEKAIEDLEGDIADFLADMEEALC